MTCCPVPIASTASTASGFHYRFRDLGGGGKQPQCRGMMNFTELASVPSDRLVPLTDQLRLAVAA